MNESTSTLYLTADGTVAGIAPDKLARDGASVLVETDRKSALDRLATVDCVVCAHTRDGIDGVALLEDVRAERADLPVLLVDETDDESEAARALAAGVTERIDAAAIRHEPDVLSQRVDAAVERHRAARERSKLTRAIEETQEGIALLDEDATFTYVNRPLADLLDYDPDVLVGTHWSTVVAGAEELPDISTIDRLEEELQLVTADGERRSWVCAVTDAGDGVALHVDASATERRAAERQLREWAEFYSNLYEISSDRELSFEAKLERLLAAGSDRLGVDLGFLTRIEDGTQEIVVAVGDHELLQSGESCPLSQAYCRKTIESDGLLGVQDALQEGWRGDPAYELFDLGCYIGGKVIVDGDLYGTLCFADADPQPEPFTDAERTAVELLTRWASYELEERRAKARLRRENDRLEGLASVVSHDLRNPLTVAMGEVSMLRESLDDERLDRIERAHDRMAAIIEDLLWLAREGRDAGDTGPVSVEAVATDAWRTADTREGAVEVVQDARIVADGDRLRQAFENLFRNAVEHGREDATIRVGSIDGGPNFFVADDGPGIPEDDRDTVFDPGHTTAEDGTGLGLSIVRTIAEAHGWTVAVVESEDGGARFEFHDVEAV